MKAIKHDNEIDQKKVETGHMNPFKTQGDEITYLYHLLLK